MLLHNPVILISCRQTDILSASGYRSVSNTAYSSSRAGASRMIAVGHNGTASETGRDRPDSTKLILAPFVGPSRLRTANLRSGNRNPEVTADAEGGPLCVESDHTRSKSEAVNAHGISFHESNASRSSGVKRLPSMAGSLHLSGGVGYRPRAPSLLLSLTPVPTPVPAVLYAPQDEPEPLGSFAPTTSSIQSLQSIIASIANKVPSFPRASRHSNDAGGFDGVLMCRSSEMFSHGSSMPPDSPTIPSICRTPSSYTDSEYFPTAPSSAGPQTPACELSPSPNLKYKLHPVLESLEDRSKFCHQTCCATCKREGTNFPCCPRCGEMWCSRECRLQGTGGKRHVCRKM